MGPVGRIQPLDLIRGIVGQHHLKRIKHTEHAWGAVVEIVTDMKFKEFKLHAAVGLVDPDALAERLGRPEANPRTVRLWQTHTRLMCAVPDVALNDAQVLAALRRAAARGEEQGP